MGKYLEEIKETVKGPNKVTISEIDKDVRYYYRGYKNLKKPNRYILVIIKYLNGEGFVISAYLESKVR